MESRPAISPPPRWVSWRSVLLGTAGVCLTAGLAPYNDYVVGGGYLIGSYLPMVLVLTFFVLVVLVNAPLHRLAPRRALAPGELAVIMVMMLAACAIPTQGLLRSLIPSLVAPFRFGASDATFWSHFEKLGLPGWMFPVPSIAEGRSSPLWMDFYSRVQPDQPVPYAAWVVPLLGWGVFFAGLFATLVAMALVIRPQWAANERLPFPIAQIELALIEPPAPGRMLNSLFSSRLFWLAAGVVVCLQSLTALNRYWPQYIPAIPIHYDLRDVFSEEPWSYLADAVKANRVYFTFVGVAYFIQARSGFSLWAIFLIRQMIEVQQRTMQNEIPAAAWLDQHLGAAVALAAGIFWIGRHHWLRVLRIAILGRRKDDAQAADGSYRLIVATGVLGLVVMLTWLRVAGVSWSIATTILATMLLAHLITARIVAETGIPFIRCYTTPAQVYANFSPACFSPRDIYMAGAMTMHGAYATRESFLPLFLHGLVVHDGTRPPRTAGRILLGLVAWSLAVSFVVGSASSLWCYYRHSTPLAPESEPLPNNHTLAVLPQAELVTPTNDFASKGFVKLKHSRPLHIGVGLGVGAMLQAAALRWSSWPFMPVGYLVSCTWYIHVTWFSFLIGWLAKVLLVRFGGAKMYQQARPLFIGLIFGEALASGIWIVISIILASSGHSYQVIRFLPT